MQRKAFQLRIRKESINEYVQAHREVWPELLDELRHFGVREYSIFRRGQELFLYLHVDDWETLLAQLAHSTVNQRWQSKMAPLFEPVPSLLHDEPFAMMEEVFYMSGLEDKAPGEGTELEHGK